MLNLIKFLIPKKDERQLIEVESHTVTWTAFEEDCIGRGNAKQYHKVFVNKQDADDFAEKLKEAAKFVKTDVKVNVYKN
jgi:hypothetical protein